MATMALSRVATPMANPPVSSRSQNRKESIMICVPTRFKSRRLQIGQFRRKKSSTNVAARNRIAWSICAAAFFRRKKISTNVAARNRISWSICAAAFSATCSSSESQTATVEKPTSTVIVAPPRDSEKKPELDDGGGYGFPPFNGGGGGGGGGGEGPFSGGFFLFIFLAFLDFLKEKMEKKSEYQD